MIKSENEVSIFLKLVFGILGDDNRCSINDAAWVGKENKTRKYMNETGIKFDDIKEVIKELTVANYSSTENDGNKNFPNELVWKFGITKTMVDVEEELYIKLKIRKFEEDTLLVMSFHPEEPKRPEDKLQFPYEKVS